MSEATKQEEKQQQPLKFFKPSSRNPKSNEPEFINEHKQNKHKTFETDLSIGLALLQQGEHDPQYFESSYKKTLDPLKKIVSGPGIIFYLFKQNNYQRITQKISSIKDLLAIKKTEKDFDPDLAKDLDSLINDFENLLRRLNHHTHDSSLSGIFSLVNKKAALDEAQRKYTELLDNYFDIKPYQGDIEEPKSLMKDPDIPIQPKAFKTAEERQKIKDENTTKKAAENKSSQKKSEASSASLPSVLSFSRF
jgi:hypothetical protein